MRRLPGSDHDGQETAQSTEAGVWLSSTHEPGWSGECWGCCLFLLAVPGGIIVLIGLGNIGSIASNNIERAIFTVPLILLATLVIAAIVTLVARRGGSDEGH